MNFNKNELYKDIKSTKDLTDRVKTFLPLIKHSNDSILDNKKNLFNSDNDYTIEPINITSLDIGDDEMISMDIQMGVFDVNEEFEKKLTSMNDITVVHLEDDSKLKNDEPLITEIASEQFDT